MSRLTWLDENSLAFPPTSLALEDPNGLLAVGGDLSCERLIEAYNRGIFPWFSDNQPYLWWSPSPRMIIIPSEVHFGRTLRKQLRKNQFNITVDQCFEEVIERCSKINRNGEVGTWISDEIIRSYTRLHHMGLAHSIETRQNGILVGGLYGVSIGKVFFGESMFSQVSGASKIAFSYLAKQLSLWNYELIDCQIHTDYLQSFGAQEVSRERFEVLLNIAVQQKGTTDWSASWSPQEFGFD
ncbi:MAG: leucyl/phenylalanyl-tRNA--protein transferase [Lentisphaeria bacterium]|jgi:leucyl/phenylalanyl-tRNA--protein transferase